MITSAQVLNGIKAQPFRPFRLHRASGKTFDIRHPQMVKVGKTDLLIFSFAEEQTEIVDRFQCISLMLIEFVSRP